MNPVTDSNTDLPAERASALRAHIVQDLRQAHKPAPALSSVDGAIHRLIHDRTHTLMARQARGRAQRLHLRLSGPIVALTVILTGSLAYFHSQGPSVVSAATVLRRASTAGISATTVSHSVYRLTSPSGLHGTGDVWLEADASGSPVGFALIQTLAKSEDAAPRLASASVQTGGTVQTYDPGHNSILTYPASITDSQYVTMSDAPYITTRLQQLASQAGAHVLPQTILDGVPVTVLQTGTGTNTDTFYFATQSYVLRGVDWNSNGIAWQARLMSNATVPLAAVPPTAFTLNAPATARVQAPDHGAGQDFLGLLASACHSTPQAVLNDMRAHPDSTGLAICQDSNPGITSDQLVAALSPSSDATTKMTHFVSTPVRYLSILGQ